MTATFIARLSIGHQRTARTGDARLSVRQSALCRMGFGQTHGAHGIFLTNRKISMSMSPLALAPSAPHRANFFQGGVRAVRSAACHVPHGMVAHGGVCDAVRLACGGAGAGVGARQLRRLDHACGP